MPDFLLEIGTEEIPARMMDAAQEELRGKVELLLVSQFLHLGGANVSTGFSTPRRMSVLIKDVQEKQRDSSERVMGPSYDVAFKDGKPTNAALGFAKKTGVPIEEFIELYKTARPGARLGAEIRKPGRKAVEVLTELLPKEIASIYWPKNMYWRAGKPERFVRPVRWIVAMLDGEVIPLEFAGIKAGNQSRGHRILGSAQIAIASPSRYSETMQGAHVTVLSADREYKIRKALDAATRTVPGARWREDAELLKTVVNLTEWPSAILGSFDKEYLSLPEEVLVTVMRDHQKYFAVEDAGGKLAPHFLAVLNTEGDPDGLIRHGNERVLRARFNDARFFWDTDQKIHLTNRVNMLRSVTFQKDLGSYFDKAERMVDLGKKLCLALVKSGLKVDANAVEQATRLAKTDLTTELVKEFTELQGVVGGLYAETQGLPTAVAKAVYDQYKPHSTEDSPPETIEGAILAIADKADSIVGMFCFGLMPSGSKDPFALRRQANGIVKILAERELPLKLDNLWAYSLETYKNTEAEKRWNQNPGKISLEIVKFFRERLQFYLRDVLHLRYDAVNAVLEGPYYRGHDEVPDLVQRARAVDEIRGLAEFEPLFIAFKRIKNIVRQAEEKGFLILELQDEEKFTSEAELGIWKDLRRLASEYVPLREARKYVPAFRALAKARAPIDKFFDSVMVMVDDEEIRAKRLGLLEYLLDEFNTIADLSELAAEAK